MVRRELKIGNYHELRKVSIGLVDGGCFVVVHTNRNGATRLVTSWKGGREDHDNYEKGVARRHQDTKTEGTLYHDPNATVAIEKLDSDFWSKASVAGTKPSTHSVHLKLDPDVFAFFKQRGKGHLTKMQDVLKAYVRAHSDP